MRNANTSKIWFSATIAVTPGLVPSNPRSQSKPANKHATAFPQVEADKEHQRKRCQRMLPEGIYRENREERNCIIGSPKNSVHSLKIGESKNSSHNSIPATVHLSLQTHRTQTQHTHRKGKKTRDTSDIPSLRMRQMHHRVHFYPGLV